jgi:hypothetical protein
LQVAPASKPGSFDVWALIDTALHRVTVHVPRTLYVDVDFEKSDLLAGARLVERTLPDGSQPGALLELQLGEPEFLAGAQVGCLPQSWPQEATTSEMERRGLLHIGYLLSGGAK